MPRSRTNVVTAFLLDARDRLLLLKRSENVRTYPGAWAAVSGYQETVDPLLQAERELRQETGLDTAEIELVRKGTPLAVDDPEKDNYWRVHPFRFRHPEAQPAVALNEEHVQYEWIGPERLADYETVPELEPAWESTSS